MISTNPDGLRRFDVVVAGRGVVGLAAALALARQSLRVALVGPATPPRAIDPPAHEDDWDSRIFALSPASRALLRQLRAWDAVPAARVAPVHDMHVFDGAGAPLQFSAYDSGVEALAWIVENRALLRALEPALGYADVTVVAATIESVRIDADAASMDLSDGGTLSCALLVGADGARSTVRAQCGLAAEAVPYDQTAVVANFRVERPHLDTAYQWFGDQGILALLPLPPNAAGRFGVSMVWSVPHDRADELAVLDGPALAARVAEASSGLLGQMETITAAQRHPLQSLSLARMSAPRVALVGDAAHLLHPLAGQGMNVGLGDVAELARVLSAREPRRDPGDALLLRRYERGRREAVDAMRLVTDGLHRLYYRNVPMPLAWARDIGWRLLEHSGPIKRRLIGQAMR